MIDRKSLQSHVDLGRRVYTSKGSTINDLGAGPEEIEKKKIFDASSQGKFFF